MANPDLLLYNGRIYPRPDNEVHVEAIAIWNGRITDIGSSRDILKLRAKSVETVDLRGRVVIPGFTDSHIHLLGLGMLMRTLDLSRTRSISEIQKAVVGAVRGRSRDAWILGRGWDQEKLRERRFPNRFDLGQAVSNPVLLKRVCGHVGAANALALSSANIDKFTPDPEGGEIVRDPMTGEPTGVLKEKALELVQRSIPKDEAETKIALISATGRLLKLGLTSLHCIIEDRVELKAIRLLQDRGKILQSIYAIIPLDLLEHAVSLGLSTEKGGGGLRIGGVKLFVDGSLGARTAALVEPYSDDLDSVGMLTLGEGQLLEAVEGAEAAGFQLCIHAIGDRAVEAALKALEEVSGAQGCRRLRHRIEHSSLTPPRLISRMRRLGVVASVQPRFIYSDSWAEQRLGARRARYLYPFRSMIRAGITLAAGSDGPVEDPNPFEGLWSAVTRPGLAPQERLTVREAIASYTIGGAFASFSEQDKGTLEPGKKADMVVLDRDPFNCGPETLRNIRVLKTIVNGQIISP